MRNGFRGWCILVTFLSMLSFRLLLKKGKMLDTFLGCLVQGRRVHVEGVKMRDINSSCRAQFGS